MYKRNLIACVVVHDARLLAWLGNRPVLQWSLAALKEVRGVDHTICFALPHLVEKTKKMASGLTVMPIARGVADKGTDAVANWLREGPVNAADLVAVIRPGSPFMPAGRIEACVTAVRRRFADVASTVLDVKFAAPQDSSEPAYVETTAGCRVFSQGKDKAATRFRPIPVTLTEALDICVPDQHRIAVALLNKALVAVA